MTALPGAVREAAAVLAGLREDRVRGLGIREAVTGMFPGWDHVGEAGSWGRFAVVLHRAGSWVGLAAEHDRLVPGSHGDAVDWAEVGAEDRLIVLTQMLGRAVVADSAADLISTLVSQAEGDTREVLAAATLVEAMLAYGFPEADQVRTLLALGGLGDLAPRVGDAARARAEQGLWARAKGRVAAALTARYSRQAEADPAAFGAMLDEVWVAARSDLGRWLEAEREDLGGTVPSARVWDGQVRRWLAEELPQWDAEE